MSNQIEIRIEAKKLSPDKFLAAAKDFFALVEGVTKNVTGRTIPWTVEVDKGSSIFRMHAESPTAESERALQVVSQGVRALRNRSASIPNGYTRIELWAAYRLASLVDDNAIQSVSIRNGGELEPLEHTVSDTADAILSRTPQIAFGGIEGKIVSLSAKHGYVCTIYDPIQRREVTCYLQSDQAQQEAVRGYTKRVLASGLVHYEKEGYAVSITVDNVRVFPPDSELPSIEDVQAVYKQYK